MFNWRLHKVQQEAAVVMSPAAELWEKVVCEETSLMCVMCS
jgi:hypothetical protein